jgi:ribosome-associated translation inhibitor RaiA
MNGKTQIVWRGTTASEALETRIRDEVAALEETCPQITAARVVVEVPTRHRHGGHFVVKVELTVPGKVLAVSRDPQENDTAEDAYAAVGEAFATARRQLVEYVQMRRGEVKHHAVG